MNDPITSTAVEAVIKNLPKLNQEEIENLKDPSQV